VNRDIKISTTYLLLHSVDFSILPPSPLGNHEEAMLPHNDATTFLAVLFCSFAVDHSVLLVCSSLRCFLLCFAFESSSSSREKERKESVELLLPY
jgi:hypothetical protein